MMDLSPDARRILEYLYDEKNPLLRTRDVIAASGMNEVALLDLLAPGFIVAESRWFNVTSVGVDWLHEWRNPKPGTNVHINGNVSGTAVNIGAGTVEADNIAGRNMQQSLGVSQTGMSAEQYFERGKALFELEEYDSAIADFTEAIRLNPQYAEAFDGRAYAKRRKRDNKGAIKDCTHAIHLNPNLPFAYYNRGFAYRRLNRYEEAIRDLTAAIVLDPGFTKAINTRGRTYFLIGNHKNALTDLDLALRLDPLFVDAYYNRGKVYAEQADIKHALDDFRQALELKPDHYAADEIRTYIAKHSQ